MLRSRILWAAAILAFTSAPVRIELDRTSPLHSVVRLKSACAQATCCKYHRDYICSGSGNDVYDAVCALGCDAVSLQGGNSTSCGG